MWRILLPACLFASISITSSVCFGEAVHPFAAPPPAATARAQSVEPHRVALVIGNGAYRDHPLANPVHDADAMRDALNALGFDVITLRNATRQQMLDGLAMFDRRIAAGGTGLVYFAGHGASVDGTTWLAPVDADVRSADSVSRTGIDLQTVFDATSRPHGDRIDLIILDSCLTALPGARNVAARQPPANTLVAYATAPGEAAADGATHGVYTAALLQTLALPGLGIAQVFDRAGAIVERATGHRQMPWVASSLADAATTLPFTAARRSGPGAVPAGDGIDTRSAGLADVSVVALDSRGVMPKDSAEQYEITFWESIKDSKEAGDYEAYLKAYPNGRFAPLAQARIARLRAAAPKAPAASAPAPTASSTASSTPASAPAPAPAAARAPAPASAAAAATAQPAHPPASPAKAPPPAAVAAPSTPQPKGSAAAANEIHDCPACPAMLTVSPGTFAMGSNSGDSSEKPAHRVTLDHAFALAKYAVTVAQWNTCRDAGACPRLPSDSNTTPNAPARDLSWDDAQQYVKWLSKISGKTYRLPTEAEWEFAARGGTATRYWWGNEMRAGNANCKDCGPPWHAEAPDNVGSFAANPFGFYDMAGGVWEWVSDCWHNSYKNAPADGHSWDEPNCQVRVIRGGSWRDGASYMPVSTRFKYDSSVRYSANGFRVARDMK
ncbi:SUMF1/EgtB/PvdO family nonheme iron enzyme [Burkholderia sp. Ac-20353]|uniref:SUMF1/EgtB/PvdO family nonheme iron enzyme n=1 Tax=Burkholderia sp. Ac-20353 TaxID=2703894 RepID=UPI00197B3A68|nr:SUMF1/EgtB/PvdO family nonheme iron enzyme [Burkholderia sp. Ac-20353]MBN3788831.1 SUMF1/EgtB/PvdO family nonheme iron enzyme [Burkholderia sp. Ac-20353]